MRRNRKGAYSSGGTQPKSSRIPTIAELVNRMSELLYLRDRVERAERNVRPAITRSKSSASRPNSAK